MSWFSSLRPVAISAMLLTAGPFLGACSFQPVYSGALASNSTLDIAYAKPNSRLEQIVYQELSLRLGSSASPAAPLASVKISTSAGGIGAMTSSPSVSSLGRIAVTATLTIQRRDGSTVAPLVISRSATAQYTTNGQVLADNTAANEAGERAAKAAAESLRLAVLATLSRQ